MKVWKLPNGMRLVYQNRPTNSVAIQVLVDVGSNDEKIAHLGVSHFIEHMVFEGTKKRKNAQEIANAIEMLGGDLNAYTTGTRTCFYVKVLKKHFKIALDVLSDIIQKPLLRDEDIERQRDILSREIDMVTDEPRFHQWVLFQKTIFKKHPSRFPTYGSHKSVATIKPEFLRAHFKKYYRPENMTVAVVGDVANVKKMVRGAFELKLFGRAKHSDVVEPKQKNSRVSREKRNISNTYVVFGYSTVGRMHGDSYVVDVIDAVLGRGQSGWMFDEIRNKHGLAYDVGTQHVAEKNFGYFAAYASTEKKNLGKLIGLVKRQFERLKMLNRKELREAKTFIEGDFLLEREEVQKSADGLLFWAQMGNPKLFEDYVKNINKVSLADVRRVVEKYFSGPYNMAVIEGRK